MLNRFSFKDKPSILFVTSSGLSEEWIDEIRKVHPETDILSTEDHAILDYAGKIDALIGCPRHLFSNELLQKAGKRLVWVHGSGAGVEQFLFPEFVESHILFTNGKIIQGPEVADHALALLLTLTRNIHLILRNHPDKPYPRPIELRGKTALIFGLGGIGILIAERAYSFGMNIIAVHPDMPQMIRILDKVYYPNEIHQALPHADAVFNATPHTGMTEQMFGYDEFKAMKRSAYFINVSRGKIVNTEDLIRALKEKLLLGAGLDVTDPEPLPDDHELHSFKNVVITPHIAGLSEHNRRRSYELIKENVFRFLNGLPLLNPVNKELGY